MLQLKRLSKSCHRAKGSVLNHFKADLVSEGWLVQSVLLLCFLTSGLIDTYLSTPGAVLLACRQVDSATAMGNVSCADQLDR